MLNFFLKNNFKTIYNIYVVGTYITENVINKYVYIQ